MPYIGKSPQNGVRNRFVYNATTSSQTAFTGSDLNGNTLSISDNLYTDVYLNGILLQPSEDYSVTSTTVTLVSGASINDVLEIIVFDIFSVADTVSASSGGTFNGAVTHTELVGIGTTTPSSYNQNGNGLVVKKSSVDGNTSGISIVSGTSATGNIYFSDATGNSLAGGAVEYNHSSNRMNVYVNDANRLQILDDGDVNVKTGNLIMGTSGKGIDFSATGDGTGSMSSEIFDDYEEGTWTATLISGGGITFTDSEENYVKIGRVVYVNIACSFSGTSSNRVEISGLPFVSSDTTAFTIFHSGGSLPSGAAFLAQSHSGHNRLSGGKSATDMTYSDVNGTTMRISGCYLASA